MGDNHGAQFAPFVFVPMGRTGLLGMAAAAHSAATHQATAYFATAYPAGV